MKTTKKQLESVIQECVQKALEGLDFGDREWMQTRQDDDALRQSAMKQAPGASSAFIPLVQTANDAFNKIKAKGDQQLLMKALPLKREVEQLAQAPQTPVILMRARMLVTKLSALSK
jgi:hypothetical protein